MAGKRAAKGRTTMQATGIGINGFGRIGRQVARIAMKDPETELKLINASYDADYLAYMMKYDTIHGKYDGTVEVDGDSLVIDGQKVALSGACAAATALGSAFVAPSSQQLQSNARETTQKTNLRASGYPESSQSSSGTHAILLRSPSVPTALIMFASPQVCSLPLRKCNPT
eukprot:TRINITY_DN3213_c0_g1_i4.p1 TRINITY_DN3213_c0_g1~~TRINITY_DN3213_c0_g1_i4.p1  ORF type:complete len:171 (+),score=36.14 TRINITY_DN3213_c0_g1_i4:219-731(+)